MPHDKESPQHHNEAQLTQRTASSQNNLAEIINHNIQHIHLKSRIHHFYPEHHVRRHLPQLHHEGLANEPMEPFLAYVGLAFAVSFWLKVLSLEEKVRSHSDEFHITMIPFGGPC